MVFHIARVHKTMDVAKTIAQVEDTVRKEAGPYSEILEVGNRLTKKEDEVFKLLTTERQKIQRLCKEIESESSQIRDPTHWRILKNDAILKNLEYKVAELDKVLKYLLDLDPSYAGSLKYKKDMLQYSEELKRNSCADCFRKLR